MDQVSKSLDSWEDSAADVAATELDADTKLEGPMLDHLVDPLTPDPSEGMTAQRAAISSRPINNLVSFHSLWTPSGPMSSSNTSRLRYEDGFQASPILGTRSNSTVRIESAPDTNSVSSSDIEVASELPSVRDVGIREHLRLWQERQSEPRAEAPSSTLSPFRQSHSTENSLTQSTENDPVDTFNEALSSEEDDDEIDSSETDVESQSNHQTYLEPGDVAYIV
ncbi:MAG: hypothetical protein Q9202_002131 [Teloschistes flavicans]